MTSTKISKIIATGLGSGLAPFASGTFGSLAAIFFWLIAHVMFGVSTLLLLLAFFLLGIWATTLELSSLKDDPDPSFVVIDEWAGMMIPLIIVSRDDLVSVLIAFFLFRLFDVLKPYPANALEKLHGSWGVMLDDIMAGIYALIFLVVLQQFFHLA